MITLRSFHDINTHPQDIDTGVVRLPQNMAHIANRGDLVRLTTKDGKSIVRIVRYGTGSTRLGDDEIAIQYDDRVELGLRRVDACELTITKVSDWGGLYHFFKTHPAPLVRLEARLSWMMLLLGSVLGAVAGIPIGYFLP